MSGASSKLRLSAASLDVLEFEPMASGQRSLRLTRSVTWTDFGGYAEAICHALSGRIIHRADSPAERVWSVEIGGCSYWLSFDDFALGVSLDSCDAAADGNLDDIRVRLVEIVGAGSAES